MDNLAVIIRRAVEDYGFRQIAQWSPDDLVESWELSPAEAEVLKGSLKRELDLLPVPIEPDDYARERERLEAIVRDSLS